MGVFPQIVGTRWKGVTGRRMVRQSFGQIEVQHPVQGEFALLMTPAGSARQRRRPLSGGSSARVGPEWIGHRAGTILCTAQAGG